MNAEDEQVIAFLARHYRFPARDVAEMRADASTDQEVMESYRRTAEQIRRKASLRNSEAYLSAKNRLSELGMFRRVRQ